MTMRDDTIYVDRYEYKDVNDLLNEIMRKFSGFNYHNGRVPECIKMTVDEYYLIMAHKEDLFMKKNDFYYILGMKVVL